MTIERLETERLVLRRPVDADAEAIFSRYASDPEVTRYLSWPRHRSVADTRDFLDSSDLSWGRWRCGPYLIELRSSGLLLGSTGLVFDSPTCASTGYVLAHDAWGQGYATEALQMIVKIAPTLGLERLYALVHANHEASMRVLDNCGFRREGRISIPLAFPNLESSGVHDAVSYERRFT